MACVPRLLSDVAHGAGETVPRCTSVVRVSLPLSESSTLSARVAVLVKAASSSVSSVAAVSGMVVVTRSSSMTSAPEGVG